VDISAVFYSLSFACSNPSFSKAFLELKERLQYFNSVADRFDVTRHFVCKIDWEEAHRQEASSTWLVKLKDLSTGESFHQQCALLISAVGELTVPNKSRFDGIETFEEDIIHTAKWKKDLSLKNKNVVVIGNGCKSSSFLQISRKLLTRPSGP
jgi:cation diffusion facilitator CzcD-associated flavoprotein CzcO